jgi:modification methylase
MTMPVLRSEMDSGGLEAYVPLEVRELGGNQSDIPRIAHDPVLMSRVEHAVQRIRTRHSLYHGDSRSMMLDEKTIHLVVTSPPYWILKEYPDDEDQLGHIADYDEFHRKLDEVWQNCYDALVPGGRLICVVGDVCLSRRKNGGRHVVVPLHATIQEHCRAIGFDNVAPIIWHKIANASYEARGGGAFLGKPYEPNAVIKNDIEYILMFRKPGGYRKPSREAKLLSIISVENHAKWFQQIWTGVTGESTRRHPAPYPEELAQRLVRMFSFVGDTVYDPFMGTGTTNVAAASWGRHSIGCELNRGYFDMAFKRLQSAGNTLMANADIYQDKVNGTKK